jgi:large subunit ribosomal protein L10
VSGQAKKAVTVDKLRSQVEKASIGIVMDYRGLTMAELTDLRRELYKEKAQFTVTKNTLLRRAITGLPQEGITPLLKGPTALALGYEDQVAPIKILKDFLKKNKKDQTNAIRGGILEGKPLSLSELEWIATLPSMDQLRGKLVGAIAAPNNQLVSALNSPQRSLVYILSQIAEKKQAAGS